jgi:actin cytoskeleton-regulatory complex protein PAN1
MSVDARLIFHMDFGVPASRSSDRAAPTLEQARHPTPPKQVDNVRSSPLAREVYSDDTTSSTEEYLSFEADSDSESEASEEGQTEEQQQAEYEARELERQRVLAAAGLIVKHDANSAPRPPARTRSLRTRRPAPAAPSQSTQHEVSAPERDLPPLPIAEESSSGEPVLRVDDAFDRYEAYKQNLAHRVSIGSSYDAPSSPSASSLALSPTMSREESRSHGYSGLLSFLGRRTPGPDSDKRSNISGLTISSPIMNTNSPMAPTREGSPAFGSVCTCDLLTIKLNHIL